MDFYIHGLKRRNKLRIKRKDEKGENGKILKREEALEKKLCLNIEKEPEE